MGECCAHSGQHIARDGKMCTSEVKIFIFLYSINFKPFIQIKKYINIWVSNFIITVRGGQFVYSPRGPRNLATSLLQLGVCVKFLSFSLKSELVSNTYTISSLKYPEEMTSDMQ
jgi:hypothetical protein